MPNITLAEVLVILNLPADAADGLRPNIERMVAAHADDCRPCMHAAIFAFWGDPLIKELGASTHCHRCHRSWRSIKEAHCVVCCTHFASNEAASYHWVDDEHIDPATVRRDKKVGGGPRYFEIETDWGPVLALSRHLEYQEKTS